MAPIDIVPEHSPEQHAASQMLNSHLDNSSMDKAVNYVLNRRDTSEAYLEDGRCSFTNNLSENAIRPFAVGRKN